MQEVERMIPIIVPQKFYVDKNGSPNAYYENNISLYINDDGFITILIRQVSYRKFCNALFINSLHKSVSLYSMLSGVDFDHLEYKDNIYDWNGFPEYPTFWVGMDDIRFITHDDIIVTTCERNPLSAVNHPGNTCLFLAKLHGNTITLKERLEPHSKEKNWMPYHHNGDIKVIYSVSPFTIKSLIPDDRTIIKLSPELETKLSGYHGSTNGIPFNGNLLFLIHKYTITTISEHRWLSFNPDSLEVRVSAPFVFFKYSFLEFNCTLSLFNNKIYAALAVNECNNYIAIINQNTIILDD